MNIQAIDKKADPETQGGLARIAYGFTEWAEKWFPDAFVFVILTVIVVALANLATGAAPLAIAKGFGDGFWTLIPFTMQMAMVAITGYVVATSPPCSRLIDWLAAVPKSGPRRGRLGGLRLDGRLLFQLGLQPGGRRLAGARARPPQRPEDGLSRRRRRRLSRPRRHLGARPVVVLGHAPGQPGVAAQVDCRHHRRHPAVADHLPVAVGGHGPRDHGHVRSSSPISRRPGRRT